MKKRLIGFAFALVLIVTILQLGRNQTGTPSAPGPGPAEPVASGATGPPASDPVRPDGAQPPSIVPVAAPAPAAAPAVPPVELREPPVLTREEKAFREALVPRKPFEKIPVQKPEGVDLQILVKFIDPLQARALEDGRVSLIAKEAPAGLVEVIAEQGVMFSTAFGPHAAKMAALVKRAEQASGNAQADLNGTLIAAGKDRSTDAVHALAIRLNDLPEVEYAYIEALDRRPLPPLDLAPPTASLVANQNYRNATFGTHVDLAWGEYGATGRDMRFGDAEWGVNRFHEDLTDSSGNPRVTDLSAGAMCQVFFAGDLMINTTPLDHPAGGQHGTAVLGIMGAGNDGYGMTGVTPDAELYFASEWVTGGRPVSLGLLADESRPGDVILLEQQAFGGFPATEFQFGGAGPADLDPTVWNTVKAATDCGIVVVITAGNGNADLDRAAFDSYRSRGDNGAIINGAGTSDATHFKLNFSSHGTPVHLQGWGQNVASPGYGALANVDGWTEANMTDCLIGNQLYTGTFSGTSSAGPLVASACVAVQSVAKAELRRTLSPRDLRQLLIDTATPQTLGGGNSSGTGIYEAESLAVTSTSGDTISTITGGGASGSFVRLDANANGDSFEFTIPNVARGSYVVKVRQIEGPDLGIYQVSTDDTGGGFTNLGATDDQYLNFCCVANLITIGTVSYSNNGDKKIRFTVTGANPAATLRRLTVDQIVLEDSVGRGKVGPIPHIAAAIRELLGTPVPQALDAAGSYTQAFDSGTPVPASGWTLLHGSQQGSTRLTGGALRMDASSLTTNAATLHLNLAGKSNVVLSYDLRDSDDENHALTMAAHTGILSGDGVCISADGLTWHGVTSWTPQSNSNGVWQRLQVNLDSAIAAAGISHTSDFRIRFQHTDNASWGTDGIELDNVAVRTSSSAQLALSIRNLGLSCVEGTSPAPVTFAVINRGNTSAPFSLSESLPWVSVNPASGTVPAGGSVTVTATFDTTSVPSGGFAGSIDLTGIDFIWINGIVHAAGTPDTSREFTTTPVASIPSAGAADRYPLPLTVTGMPGRIVDLDIKLWGVTHTHFDDLDILLVSPDGREVLLMSDAGGGDDLSGIHLHFDDDAAGPIGDNAAPASGNYRPSNHGVGSDDPFPGRPAVSSRSTSLATFNAADPNGTWTLYIFDDAGGDSGSISGFQLYITTDTGLGGISEQFTGGADAFDLDGVSLMFTPDDSPSGFGFVPTAITALPTVHGAGAKDLELTDDSSAPWFTGSQPFPFRGTGHETVHIGSNGHVTLGAARTSSIGSQAALHIQPVIAALAWDLNPAAGGTVRAENFADRSVVTWQNVRSFLTADSNTFQVDLFYDGRVRMSWLGIDVVTPVTGISAGFFNSTALTETDFVFPRRAYTANHLPHPVPGLIQAEDYDEATLPPFAYGDLDSTNAGGAYRPDEGVDIEACSDTGGGHNVAFTNGGEWTEYTVNVAQAGNYTAYLRVAAPNGGGLSLDFDGVEKSGYPYFGATPGFQDFRTFVVTGMPLAAGQQTLRVNWLASNSNLNHITFIKEDAGNESGLVAHWKFDHASGSSVTDAAGNHDGTIHGATGWLPAGGVSGGALDLTGFDNWVTVPTDDLLKLRAHNGSYTVSTWVRLDQAGDQALLYHGRGCSSWASWSLAVGQLEGVSNGLPGSLGFSIRTANDSGAIWLADPAPVELGQWVHAAATSDGDTLRFFVNGTQVGSTPLSGALPYDSPESELVIGADPGCATTGRTPADGRIDDVRVYVRALTPQEIQAQALSGLLSAADRDGDGQSNGTENAFGTNPFDSSSFMTLAVTRSAGGQSLVQFPAVAGRGYEVQYSPDLSTTWITIASFGPVQDGTISFTDTDATRNSRPKGFYRIAAP